ncbi:hypothetical protein HYV64_04500 [Candidatus Shapirobacteria bacterium]|nr:hypothetical protein [Candidatus Shapirobacteria bacterium]
MTTREKILDIAMNLNRVGNWAADGYEAKQKRIRLFVDETSQMIKTIEPTSFPKKFRKTFDQFLHEYEKLKKEIYHSPKNELLWAETMMTWGNILTHRARLLE